MKTQLGDQYVERIYSRFPKAGRTSDYCCYWFRKAHEHLGSHGRAGLVATNSIREGNSRRAALDYIESRGGHLHNVISTQPWSGEAKVFVSIVNWSLEKPKTCIINGKSVSRINTSLSEKIDATKAPRLKANLKFAFQGVIPVCVDAFTLSPATGQEWIRENSQYKEILKEFLTADDLTDRPLANPRRWIIDFNDMTLEEAEEYDLAYKQALRLAKPERETNRDEKARTYWWRFLRTRPLMRKKLEEAGGYICIPIHSKWFIPLSAKKEYLPGNSTIAVASQDNYILGLMTSKAHRIWIKAQKSTLKGDTRYTHTTCFETFPFPQAARSEQISGIRQAMTELNEYRNAWMTDKKHGITELYNRYFEEPSSILFKLHQQLDLTVLEAYAWKSSDDLLSKLYNLNRELAELESNQQTIIGPWESLSN